MSSSSCRLSWVQVDVTVYYHGDVVVLENELLPTFGVIKDMIVFDVDRYYFVCEVLSTECFVNHFHSFEVTKQNPTKYSICKQPDFVDHHILHAYSVTSYPHSLFVPLKYHLIENIV